MALWYSDLGIRLYSIFQIWGVFVSLCFVFCFDCVAKVFKTVFENRITLNEMNCIVLFPALTPGLPMVFNKKYYVSFSCAVDLL
jgi:hypothetical protein